MVSRIPDSGLAAGVGVQEGQMSMTHLPGVGEEATDSTSSPVLNITRLVKAAGVPDIREEKLPMG